MTRTASLVEAVGGLHGLPGAVGVLGRHPLVEATVDPGRGGGAGLHRAGRDALVDDALAHHDVAALEELVAAEAGHAEGRGVEHHVAPGALVDERRAGRGLLHVDEHVERLVVDDHGLGGVGPLGAVVGDDRGDGLADVAHLVAGQHGPGDHRVEGGGRGLEPQAGGGVDRHDPRHGFGVGGVDAGDDGVGHGRADVGDVESTLEQRLVQVGEVDGAGRQELRILATQHAVAEDASGHVVPPAMA